VDGVAVFADLRPITSHPQESFRLDFDTPGASSTSFHLPVRPGPATGIRLVRANWWGDPLPWSDGTVGHLTLQVRAVDALGNLVPRPLTVTVAQEEGPPVQWQEATTREVSYGVAGFKVVASQVGTYRFSADVTDFGTFSSEALVLGPGYPVRLVFLTPPPASAAVGEVLAPAVVVGFEDGWGNAISDPPVEGGQMIEIHARLRYAGPETLAGTTQRTLGPGGTVTFDDLAITGVSGEQRLEFRVVGYHFLDPLESLPIALSD
jgi:hypothetical protein